MAVVGDTIERHGRLDYLFNNVGISVGGETHLMPPSYWDRIIDVNLRGRRQRRRRRLPAHGRARASATSSTPLRAPAGSPARSPSRYSTTKHAVVGLSTTLRPEAALHGVRVSVLCPGPVDTPILDSATAGATCPPRR